MKQVTGCGRMKKNQKNKRKAEKKSQVSENVNHREEKGERM